MRVERVISGAQTGADQAGLRAAVTLGIPTGGMMPHGWRTEDGRHPEFQTRYGLTESRYEGYDHRTRFNIRAADATWIFTFGGGHKLDGGSALTETICRATGASHLIIVLSRETATLPEAIVACRQWLIACKVKCLNVAGNRESKAPGIGAATEAFLIEVLRT